MKRLGKILGVLLVFMVGQNGFAQQDPMYSMYMLDKMLINPAYTGSANWMVGTLKYRQQFVGMDGAPTTQTFNFHAPLKGRKAGLGVKVIKDQIAVINNLNASIFYAYHLNTGAGKLSFGIEGGVYTRKIDYSNLGLTDAIDNAFPVVPVQQEIVPDLSWGLYYSQNQFYAGVSQSHALPSEFEPNSISNIKSRLYGHHNLIIGNVFDLSGKLSLEPSVLVKYIPAAPIQVDVNATLFYNEFIGLGLQYRTNDAAVAFLKVNITESLRVAFAYDYTLSGLQSYSDGAYEVLLSYGFKLAPAKSVKEIHPRYYF